VAAAATQLGFLDGALVWLVSDAVRDVLGMWVGSGGEGGQH
jgi:hypothetical protein